MAQGKEFANSSFFGDANLQAYYKLSSGALTTDSSGNSKTLTNTNSVGEITGKFDGGAGVTTNTNKQLTTSDTLGIGNTTARSISLWVRRTGSMTTNGVIAGHYAGATGYANYIQASDADSIWFVSYGTSAGTTGACDLTLDTWHHLVLVDNGTTIYGYKDGVLQGSTGRQSGTSSGWVAGFHMFARANDSYCANIDIDDVAVFDRALTSVEIRQLALGLNSTDWSNPYEIQSDSTKVSGSSDLTDFPALISGANLSSAVYAGLSDGEINGTGYLSDPTLKAYYRFESGALTTDTSGNSHTLTAIGGGGSEGTGQFGGDVSLASASSQAYSATDGADFKPTGNFSVSAWVKTSTSGTAKAIMQSWSVNTNRAGWSLVIGSTNLVRLFSGANTGATQGTHWQVVDSTTSVTDGSWHHVVGVWTGTYLDMYVDGVREGHVSWSTAPAYAGTNYVRVGCQNYSGTNLDFMNGEIDDLALFNGKALSAKDVQALYQGGSDLRITTDSAGTTEVPFEIVSLDTSAETCEIWAKVPTLSYNSSTSLFLWYGNSSALPYSATDTYGSQNVWTNWSGVWHGNDLLDSTSGANTLSQRGTVSNSASQIGNGFDASYTDSTNHLYEASVLQPTTGDVMLSCWFKKSSAPTADFTPTILMIGDDSGTTRCTIEATKTNGYAKTGFTNSGTDSATSTTNICDNSWHYLVVTRSGTSLTVYVDGSSVATGTSSKSITGDDLHIGYAGYSVGGYDYIGAAIIDEARVTATDNSSDWIATEYNNQNDPSTFWTPISGRRIFVIS